MPDLTGSLNLTPTAQRNYSMIEPRTVVIDMVKEVMLASGTYNIFTLAIGEACIGGFIAVETALLTGDSIKVKIAADGLTGAVTDTAMGVGDIITFGNTAVAATTGYLGYAKTVADTIDIALLGSDFTAGVFVFCAYIVNVKTIIDANIT